MTKLTFFPLIIDRWVSGTRQLTYEQKGFYIDLIVWLFETGEPIKNADHAAKILGCDPRTSRRLLADLRPKFRLTSAGLRHKLVDKLLRNGCKLRGLETINFPLDPDPDPDPDKRRIEEKKSNQKKAAPSAPLVDGLDKESWASYLDHRRAIRARKLKPESETRLMRWLVDQPDQAAIVDETIRNGWTGLFELKAGAKPAPAKVKAQTWPIEAYAPWGGIRPEWLEDGPEKDRALEMKALASHTVVREPTDQEAAENRAVVTNLFRR